jgi:hypothetical protein
MKKVCSVVIAFALLLSFNRGAYSQSDEEKLTLREAGETQKIMRAFTERLEEKMDLVEALQGISADDWPFTLINGTGNEGADILGIKRDLALNNKVDYERFYGGLMSLLHLHSIYSFSQPKSENSGKDNVPSDVLQVLRTNRDFASAWEDGNDLTISNGIQLHEAAETVEKALPLMRAHVLKLKNERADDYWSTLVKLKKRYNSKPSLDVCHGSCWGQPDGTRIIMVTSMPFYLALAMVRGQMKIIGLAPYSD